MSGDRCKYCGSLEFDFKNKGPHLGAYCKACGKWHKWVSQKLSIRDNKSGSGAVELNEPTLEELDNVLNYDIDDKEPW